jgi:hypothetical protein
MQGIWRLLEFAPALPVLTIHGPLAGAKETYRMAQQSLKTKAALAARKLDGQLDDRDVYAKRITNADLARKDEMDDEVEEFRREYARLVGLDTRDPATGDVVHIDGEIDDEEDEHERLELRAKARGIADSMRRLDARMLGVYVEDENGEAFPDEVFEATPIQTLTALTRQATEWTYGRAEDDPARPTSGRSGSG